ncbi:TPA: phage tail protein, partial [Staphylococcus aureus]|nr:phage tail protein [Staphylococcus aureus]
MAEGQGSYKVGFKRLYVGVFNPEATKVVKR